MENYKDENIKVLKDLPISISLPSKYMQQDAINFVYNNINEHLKVSSYFLNCAIIFRHDDSVK